MAFSALWFGLKPLLRLKNFASQIGSNTCRIHCWMSLSIIVGIPRGRVFPLSFGISTLRTALGIYQSSLRWTWATKAFSFHLFKSLIVYYPHPPSDCRCSFGYFCRPAWCFQGVLLVPPDCRTVAPWHLRHTIRQERAAYRSIRSCGFSVSLRVSSCLPKSGTFLSFERISLFLVILEPLCLYSFQFIDCWRLMAIPPPYFYGFNGTVPSLSTG